MQKDFTVKRILTPVDFSDSAAMSLDNAVSLAKLMKAELYLLHIIETSTFPSFIAHAFSGFEKKVEDASNDKLNELCSKLEAEHGLKVHCITETGKIYRQIVHCARQSHIDLIVMGTHGSGGSSYIIGSNTTRVVQEAPCPVISVQEHVLQTGFSRIGLPIDDSPESRQKVNFAMELARHSNAIIHIIGLQRNGNEDYQRKFRIKIDQVEDFLNGHNIRTETLMKKSDDIAKITLEGIDECKADLVVIMTEQEAGLAGLLMGSYANKIINGARIPVMTVRPAEIDPERITVTF